MCAGLGWFIVQLLYGNTLLTGRLLERVLALERCWVLKPFLISLYVLMHSTATLSYGLEVPMLLIVLHIYDHNNLANKELSIDKKSLDEY